MARTQRLDRKTLKQDALVNFMGRAADYVTANANLFFGVVAAVIIGIVLLIFWARGRTERTVEANLRVGAVVGAFSAGEYETALQMADALRGGYPGTRGAVLATFVTGQANLQMGNHPAAEQAFRSYLDSQSKAPFYADAARLGLAASLEGQQRYQEAAALFLETADQLDGALADQARLDAARSLRLAGSYERAKTLLQTLAKESDTLSRQASVELAVVEGLDGATAPAAAPTPAVEESQAAPEPNP